MTQDMTEMILTERDTCCETEQGNSLCTYKEMSPSRHTLSILMEQLRSSLGAGKEQLKSSLGAAYAMPTLCRDAHLNDGCRGKWCMGAND